MPVVEFFGPAFINRARVDLECLVNFFHHAGVDSETREGRLRSHGFFETLGAAALAGPRGLFRLA